MVKSKYKSVIYGTYPMEKIKEGKETIKILNADYPKSWKVKPAFISYQKKKKLFSIKIR